MILLRPECGVSYLCGVYTMSLDRWCLVASVVGLFLTATTAASATTCGPTGGTNTNVFTATVTESPCYATGNGSVNLPTDHPFGALSPLVFIDKSGDAVGPLAITGALAGHGTWTLNNPPTGYSKFVLLFLQ